MKKTPASHKKATGSPRATLKKAPKRKPEPRLQNAAQASTPAAPATVVSEPLDAPAPTRRSPAAAAASLPVALARMLEEETWWRVVRIGSPEPTTLKITRHSQSRRSSGPMQSPAVGRASAHP